MKVGDLVRVRVGDMAIGLKVCIGIVTGPTLGYYVPVQIGNVTDLYNVERVKVISETR